MEKRTLQVLEFIKNNQGCKVQDVTEHLGISRPLVSSILLSLEELDLIKRELGSGRSVALRITGKGEEILGGNEHGT